jgi:hypothetical protein
MESQERVSMNPCPACKADRESLTVIVSQTRGGGVKSYTVLCGRCGEVGPAGSDHDEAVTGWSTGDWELPPFADPRLTCTAGWRTEGVACGGKAMWITWWGSRLCEACGEWYRAMSVTNSILYQPRLKRLRRTQEGS